MNELLIAKARRAEKEANARLDAARHNEVIGQLNGTEDRLGGLLSRLIAAIPKLDLSPVLKAIRQLPKPEKVDLSPVLKAVQSIPKADLSPVLSAVKAIPKPDPVDLSHIMSALTLLSDRIDALQAQVSQIDVSLPEIHIPEQKTQAVVVQEAPVYEFEITRNQMGGIKSVVARPK